MVRARPPLPVGLANALPFRRGPRRGVLHLCLLPALAVRRAPQPAAEQPLPARDHLRALRAGHAQRRVQHEDQRGHVHQQPRVPWRTHRVVLRQLRQRREHDRQRRVHHRELHHRRPPGKCPLCLRQISTDRRDTISSGARTSCGTAGSSSPSRSPCSSARPVRPSHPLHTSADIPPAL